MPKSNGLELARAVRNLDAGLPILLMSGYSDMLKEAEGRKTFPFIRKPFLAPDLLKAIQSVMGGH